MSPSLAKGRHDTSHAGLSRPSCDSFTHKHLHRVRVNLASACDGLHKGAVHSKHLHPVVAPVGHHELQTAVDEGETLWKPAQDILGALKMVQGWGGGEATDCEAPRRLQEALTVPRQPSDLGTSQLAVIETGLADPADEATRGQVKQADAVGWDVAMRPSLVHARPLKLWKE
jgi:hypothetical protein